MSAQVMRTADEVVIDALYAEIFRLLESCTEQQVGALWRIYPPQWVPLRISDLRSLLALVQRTVKLNQASADQ